jgi:hypothetical protein
MRLLPVVLDYSLCERRRVREFTKFENTDSTRRGGFRNAEGGSRV